VVLKELQVDEGIPSGISFGKCMGLAGQGIKPIAQGANDTLNGTVAGSQTPSPKAARISTESSFPCSSRCLMVCVKRTSGGTTNAGRPRCPVRIGCR
jgi:hypothetical protein